MKPDTMKLADMHLRSVDQSMRAVEQKASTLLTISLALFSFSLTVLPNAISIFHNSFSSGGKMFFASFFVLAFFLMYSILSIIGIHKLIRVIAPKFISTNVSKKKSLIYFEDFKLMKIDNFRDGWHKFTEEQIMDELIDRVYFTGLLLSDKYKSIKEAVYLLEWAGFLAIIFILIINFIEIIF